MHTREI